MIVQAMDLIPAVKLITPKAYIDKRGSFLEVFSQKEYGEALGIKGGFVQDNVSRSHKGVLRGLHYQNDPFAQGKLVSVMQGSVYDVAVDLRPDSETFGTYVGVVLSAANYQQFWIPPGFAHGFLALEDDTVFLYKCTDYYNVDAEGGIYYNDPNIAIKWSQFNAEVIVSQKDKFLPTLSELQ